MVIDLVYLWVNGNDPEWVARRNAFIGKPTGKQENCEARYADSGELKYSLRSIEKYAPWIHKIYIVTDNQVPEWLDTTNPKVQIVDHTEIMPKESLPCYNSALIEHFLHNIPGLSEHFLYGNDDMLINQPVTPETFFAQDQYPYEYMFRKRFRKQGLFLTFLLREKILKKRVNLNVQAVHNAATLVEKHYGTYYGCKPHHNIDAYTKSSFEFVNNEFRNEINAMRLHHLRSAEDIQRCIYSFVNIARGKGHLRYVTNKHSFHLQISNHDQYKQLEMCNPVFFCVNDSEHSNNDDRKICIDYLENRFPNKSQYEK